MFARFARIGVGHQTQFKHVQLDIYDTREIDEEPENDNVPHRWSCKGLGEMHEYPEMRTGNGSDLDSGLDSDSDVGSLSSSSCSSNDSDDVVGFLF